MIIDCPACQKQIPLKDAKPGRYKAKCPKCAQRLSITVPSEHNAKPTARIVSDQQASQTKPTPVSAASPAGDAETSASAPAATAAFENKPPQNRAPNSASSADGPDATGAIQPSPDATQPGGVEDTAAPAATLPPSQAPATPIVSSPENQRRLGGYAIERELGRGAMGAVYLARQLSLDRPVALKVIQTQYAQDPVFLARFTREAYAAAQLTHHNVVQMYDLGAEGETNFFSMEYVNGKSLDQMLKEHGKLDPEAAIGFALQVARGLHFAHSQGMVHRDIKPDNIMVNNQGVVKVADLGLVKTLAGDDESQDGQGATASTSALASSRADVTSPNMAMGTPLFMAPEQAENAAGVDHRADIYSLGCTLYTLITGKPPFTGATAVEVITKHKSEPMPRPDAVVKRIPPEIADIVMKMVAKSPSDRYQNLQDVIDDLERCLGVQSSGVYSPREEHVQELEQAVGRFNDSSIAKLRSLCVLGFFAATALLVLVSAIFSFSFAVGLIGMGAAAIAGYFVISGFRDRSLLFDKFREILWHSRLVDWLTWIGGGLMLLVVLYLLGALFTFIALAIVGAGIGAAFHFVVDGLLQKDRKEPVDAAEKLLRTLRLRGVDEEALHQFAAKYAGANWEEFFETLFGYQAKLAQRETFRRTEQGRRTRKFRAWRDPVIRWASDKVRAAREEKERKHLARVEEKNLQSQGMDEMQARNRARLMADALIDEAAATRTLAVTSAGAALDPAAIAAQKRARIKANLADARSGKYSRKNEPGALVAGPLGHLLGAKLRFAAGCLLVVGCLMWARQNGVFTGEQIRQAASAAANTELQGAVDALDVNLNVNSAPLKLPLVGWMFDSFNAGAAGIVLLFTAFFRGWKMSLFALPAAAVIWLGPVMSLPGANILGSPEITCLAAGLGLAAIGVFFGRDFSSE